MPRLRRRDGRAPLWIELGRDRLAVLALRRDQQLRADARRARARTTRRDLLSLERSLHIDLERALNRWLAAHMRCSRFFATYYYFFAHAIVTFAVLALLWWRRPGALPRGCARRWCSST